MEKLILIFVLILCSSCGVIKGHKNPAIDYSIKVMDEVYIEDNILEEITEEAFEDMTGLEIDLSPGSPEE